MESDELIKFSKEICSAINSKDMEFIEKHFAENMFFKENFFGKKYTTNFQSKDIFEKYFVNSIAHIFGDDVFITFKGSQAKVIYEIPSIFNLEETRFRYGFVQNIFCFVKTNDEWKLKGAEYNMTWFSKRYIGQSLTNLVGCFFKQSIIYERKF